MAKAPSQSHITRLPQPPEPAYNQNPRESRKDAVLRLLRIAQYITTTPWQNLNIAAQQVIDMHDETARDDIIMRWAKDKRTEFKYVSLAVCIPVHPIPHLPTESQIPTPFPQARFHR